jgi:hypothetical protein
MNIFIMTGYANNDVCVFGWDDWDFIAILVLLVVFAFGTDILNRILDFLETYSKGKLVMKLMF